MSYILYLASWYPSRIDPLDGDFIQRHAESISLSEKVVVLFLVKDPAVRRPVVDIRKSREGLLLEYIVYYREYPLFDRLASLVSYLMLGHRMVRRIRNELGVPSLVHVNVVWKAGLLGLYLKKRFGWNYLLTEHWTGYTRKDLRGLHTKSYLTKLIYKKVIQNASLLLPVSRDLGRQIGQSFPGTNFEVIYNAVSPGLFYYTTNPGVPAVKKCIHISTMNDQKNIEGILRVLETLVETRKDIEITLVGPFTPGIRRFLEERGYLGKKVFLTGILPHTELALLLRQSHLLFLFSRFENQPCVLLEALCCGLPVIATAVGGIPEIIDNSNGILVESEREDQLLQAFHTLLDHYSSYDREKIAIDARAKFSYPIIGGQLSALYRRRLAQK